LMISDDAEVMARAVMLSGSYMLYGKHRAAPPPEAFAELRYEVPNVSGRMDNLRAAILRPQLRALKAQCARWNARYRIVDAGLADTPGLTLIERPARERFVASSHQFLLLDWGEEAIRDVLLGCAARGVELKWFGAAEPVGFTSTYGSWRYAPSAPMPATDRILRGIVDMRLPLTFTLEDCAMVARIVRDEVSRVFQRGT
ncbi:MAG: DegT/DnrJ/EryC1/StrS family aminotransferase, partial [Shimia sp.]